MYAHGMRANDVSDCFPGNRLDSLGGWTWGYKMAVLNVDSQVVMR
jgi:hypothetical protein